MKPSLLISFSPNGYRLLKFCNLRFAFTVIIIFDLFIMAEKYDSLLRNIRTEVQPQNFERYILKSQQNKNELIFNIRTTKTKGLPRFNIWRLLLDIIPFTQSWEEKIAKLEASRKRWASLKDQSKGVPKSIGKQGPLSLPRNPLMKSALKPEKKQGESDNFLHEQIRKDVLRTYQQLPFFQDASVLKLLTNVLFVWCKANPDVSYKQGMNEILASVVWVYFHEAAAANYEYSNETEKRYQVLNSVAHAEADIFIVFEKIMEIQKEMFKENLDSEIKGVINPNSKNNSPILQRISQLEDNKLKVLDIQLYRALKLQDVKTKSFLLRWIRCLHSRQFGLVGSLPIWDSIFLDAYESASSTKGKRQFEFVDAMCLSMFIYLRSIILTLQTANEITQVYQKYPPLEGQCLQELLGLAWSVSGELHALDKGEDEADNKGVSIEIKMKKVEEKNQATKIEEKKVISELSQNKQPQIIKPSEKVQKNDDSKIDQLKTNSTKQQSSLDNRQVSFDSNEIKTMLDKLTQSNTYNEQLKQQLRNGESKKLVRSVIELLQTKLKS